MKFEKESLAQDKGDVWLRVLSAIYNTYLSNQ